MRRMAGRGSGSPAVSIGVFAAAACLGSVVGHAQAPDAIRVPLVRNDNAFYDIGKGLTFDAQRVAEHLAKTPVRLPDPLPPGAAVGLSDGDYFVIVEPDSRPESVFLTVDANMNRDLRDDARIEVTTRKKRGDEAVIRIRRTYPGTPPKEVWLPYRFAYSPRKNQKGEPEPGFFVTPAYRMEGTFRLQQTEYAIELSDFIQLGRFDKSNLSKGTVIRVRAADDPPEAGALLWGYELIPFGGEFYEVRDEALDGSWIELARSILPHAAIGRPVPDFRLTDTDGKAFSLGEYRGRYLLLDFWPSWCGPCVAEFANIKKTVERYANQPLSVVGINLDFETRLETARKVIADKALPWRQVMEGKGEFLPIYQILGRLPEQRMAFPLYVVIGPDGVVRYATNSFRTAERSLEASLAPAAAGQPEAIFVPLAASRTIMPCAPLPADFTSPSLASAVQNPNVKLPADLESGAVVGQLPSGRLLVVRQASAERRLRLRVDAGGDQDLTNDEDKEIPVLDTFPATPEGATSYDLVLSYASGGQAFRPYRFFALTSPGAPPPLPRVFYYGWEGARSGTFVRDGVDYQIKISDPTCDGIFTPDDANTAAFLTLRKKQGNEWTAVRSDALDIPIGGRLYRVTHVEDDGRLVVLEQQRQPPAVR